MNKTRDLLERLTLNQDLMEEKLVKLKTSKRHKKMKENKAELKQKLRIKERFILRNSIKVGSIEEHNNKL